MSKQLILWLTIIFTGTPVVAESLDKQIDSIRIVHNLPALGVYSFVDGQTDESVVKGIRKMGDPTQARTADKFHFGSDGKAMTATLVALLIEDGRLQWTSTLNELLPNLNPPLHAKYRNVTLEMLLTHRSGMTGNESTFENGHLWRELWRPDLAPGDGRTKAMKRILSVEPATEPGSKHEYSNFGYMIIGGILERMTGRTYEQLLVERLWTPLGMSSCGFGAAGDPNASTPDQPWPHEASASGPMPMTPGFKADNPPSTSPAGRMHCSMADWAKFLKLHANGFDRKPTPILTTPSFVKLHTQYPGDDYTYGAWIRYDDEKWAQGPVLLHEGSNTMNHAIVVIAPTLGAGFISVSNTGNAGPACHKALTIIINHSTQSPN